MQNAIRIKILWMKLTSRMIYGFPLTTILPNTYLFWIIHCKPESWHQTSTGLSIVLDGKLMIKFKSKEMNSVNNRENRKSSTVLHEDPPISHIDRVGCSRSSILHLCIEYKITSMTRSTTAQIYLSYKWWWIHETKKGTFRIRLNLWIYILYIELWLLTYGITIFISICKIEFPTRNHVCSSEHVYAILYEYDELR